MKKTQVETLIAALREAYLWTRMDRKSMDDLTPNRAMLNARMLVIRKALKKAGVKP